MSPESQIAPEKPRRYRAAAVGIGVLLLGAAACSSATHAATGGGGGGSSSSKTVSVGTAGSAGKVLVTSSGMTLYVNNKDTATHQACTSSCQVFWKPLSMSGHGMPTGPSAVAAGLGVRTTPTGRQVTYKGKLLYTFTQDHSAGQANGNNFSDSFGGVNFTWFAATPAGKAAPAPASSSSQGGGNGGGYGGY